jgi:hypothetical protein
LSFNLNPFFLDCIESGLLKEDLEGLPRQIKFPVRGMAQKMRYNGILVSKARSKDDVNTWDKGPLYTVFMALWGQP